MALTTNVTGATSQTTSFTNNGFTTDTVGGVNFPLQNGVPYQNNYMFKVIPATTSNTCVASSQTWPGATTSYTLNTIPTLEGTQVLSKPYIYKGPNVTIPQNGVNVTVIASGTQGIQLDCERSLSVTLSGTVTTSSDLTIYGLDYRGVAMSAQVQLTVGFTAGNYSLIFPFSVVTSITASANPGVSLSFGNAMGQAGQTCNIGLPYLLPQLGYVNSCYWADEALDTTNIQIGNTWRLTPPLAELAAGDNPPRGYVAIPDETDGSSLLCINYFVYGSDSEMNGELMNLNQSTTQIVEVQKTPTNNIAGVGANQSVWPYLRSYDLVGMIYPGDLDVATQYYNLITAA